MPPSLSVNVGVPLTVEECHRELAALPDRDVFDLAIRRAGLPPEAGHRDALVRARVEGYLAAVADDPPIEPQEVVAVEDATGGAQAARAAGMRVAAIRGLGYDPASGYADVIIDRLDLPALELILALGTGQRRS